MTGTGLHAHFLHTIAVRGNLFAHTGFIATVASGQGMNQTMVSAVNTVSETTAVGYSAGSTRASVGAPKRMAQLAGKSDQGEAGATQQGSSKVMPSKSAPASRTGNAASGKAADAVSASLRQAYESTLDEAIPDSLMDLLRKLD